MSLEILPVKKTIAPIQLRRQVHEDLPNPEEAMLMCLVASVRSGKSTIITNLLANSNFYRDAFHECYIFSSTIDSDDTMVRLKEMFPGACHSVFDEMKLHRIIERQKTYELKDRPSVCIVMDDLHDIRPNSLWFTIASAYRHFGLSLIYSVQKSTMLPRVVRAQCNALLVGNVPPIELERLANEYGERYGNEKNFKNLYMRAVDERYQWLFCNMQCYPAKAYKNFNHLLWSGDE